MKKTALLFFFLVTLGQLMGQRSNSVLAEGTWYQFAVDTTGVFKIDRNFLQQLGVDVGGLNPRKLQIYGNGGGMLPERNADFRYDDLQENAIHLAGEADGRFDTEDYILLYAQGPQDWEANISSESITHHKNRFSDKAYYFLTINERDGKRIALSPPITENPSETLTVYDDFTFFEKDDVNLFAAGRQWFYEQDFNINNPQTFILPFDKVSPNDPIQVTVRAVSNSVVSSSMGVQVGSTSFALNFPAVNPNALTKAFAVSRTQSVVQTTDQIAISINYQNNGNPAANAFLDYIFIQGKKALRFTNQQFAFRSFAQAKSLSPVRYSIQNGGNAFQVWDVSDPINVNQLSNLSANSDFEFIAQGNQLGEYVVLAEDDFYEPQQVENPRVPNQNLHALGEINYLIITTSELASQAQRLANYHQSESGLSTHVVLVDQIYKEFASGSPDITAVRDFIKRVYENSTANPLQYVCFFGDSSYDYKDRIPNNTNMVPVQLAEESFNLAASYVTDDYFVMLDADEGTMNVGHDIDVVSSRIPVSSQQEAQRVVDKILSMYESASLGDWRNSITLIADDMDVAGEQVIMQGVESIADEISINQPMLNLQKIYADAFVQENSAGGERYPEVKKTITDAMEKGTLLLDYFGHGGEDGFASERFLDVPQIQSFQNENTLPLFITVTCEFSRFDNPNRMTAGELLFKNPRGGAASMITTTREVFISTGQRFNEQLIRRLLRFNGEQGSIAEALMQTKNQFSSNQKYFIYHFGDPAMRLALPKPNIQITKMNGIDVTQSLDTLKALSRVTFEGIIADENDQALTDFNGTVSTTIFDKRSEQSTLDNDGFGFKMPFDTQNSSLFRGSATVENGQFQFDFVVPKDIRIAYGKGKLSFYAEDGRTDRGGANFDVIVGGIDENAPEDTVGPEVQLFLNDESFVDGGNTNSSPNLIVRLVDPSGINTSITAVNHDIVAILDGDQTNPIVLNDFYQTELNDFTQGKVTYRLRDLEVGPHTLTLKAWDTYNNSSEATLHFVVVSDTELLLENVLNYPNPFVNYTEFWFHHNKPNEPLEVQVQIFTVSGKLVKTINQQVQTPGTLARSITWDGLDDFGNKIGKGVYVYKLRVKATLSNLVAERYEKLVILQ